jgi:putative transposase
VSYPFADATFTVTHCGRICFHGRKINLSHVFAGQNVGVTQVGERIWLVTFMHYDLGYFDDEVGRVEPIENPFGSKVFTPPPGMNCYLSAQNRPKRIGGPDEGQLEPHRRMAQTP